MAISGITTTADNGIERITTNQTISGTGTIDSETVVLTSSASRLETGTSTGSISVTRSEIMLEQAAGNNTNDADAVMNYGGRAVTTTTLSFVDSIIQARNYTARHNIQVTELTRTKVIEGDGTAELFVYTGTNAIVDDVLFRGINVWEIYAPPSVLFNVTVDDVDYAYLNWEAGRLDFFGFAVSNIATAHAWMGTNNNGDNHSWQWNNDPSFNNQLMYLTDTNNRYYDGFTATWVFIDRDTSTAVQNVLVIFKDNYGGSMATRGTYTTNSNGRLAGTYDSQNRTTGSNIERPTLFIMKNAVDDVDEGNPGAYTYPVSTIGGDQGDRTANYDIDAVSTQIEIRSYLHERPVGHVVGNTYTITAEIGSIASDLSVNRYQNFILVPDAGISQTTKATVDAYTSLSTLDMLYDRIKAEWYDNNDYPIALEDGAVFDMGTTDLIVDGDAVSAFAYASGPDEITIYPGSGGNLGIGTKFTSIEVPILTVQDGATIEGLTVDGNVQLTEVVDIDDLTVTGELDFDTAGTYNWDNAIIDEVTNSSGSSVTLNLTGTSDITTNTGPNITINYNVTATVTIVDQSGNAMAGVEVAVFQDNAARTAVIASTSTDENGQVSATVAAGLGAVIVRARQSTSVATFDTSQAFTSEVLTTDATHGFEDGDPAVYSKNGGTAVVGLTAGTTYYVNSISATTLSLHTTAANAISDSSRVDLTTDGSETHHLDPQRYIAGSASGTIGTTNFSTQITMVVDSIATA